MTAIAIWRNTELPNNPSLWAVADSLVSQGPMPLIGDAAKLFSLPVVCRIPGPDGFFSQICFEHSYGYAFAGSTLVGQNTYLSLIPLLTNLVYPKHYAPTLMDVAAYVTNYFAAIFDDLRISMGANAIFDVAIFGWCPVRHALEIYRIKPTMVGTGVYEIKMEFIDFTEEQFVYLGDSSTQISELISAAIAAEGTETRRPKTIIESCISSEDYPTIGGDVQVAIADKFGFKPYVVYRPSIQPPGGVSMIYLGREIKDQFRHLGSAFVSLPALP